MYRPTYTKMSIVFSFTFLRSTLSVRLHCKFNIQNLRLFTNYYFCTQLNKSQHKLQMLHSDRFALVLMR